MKTWVSHHSGQAHLHYTKIKHNFINVFPSLWSWHCRRCLCLHGAYVVEAQRRWKTEKIIQCMWHVKELMMLMELLLSIFFGFFVCLSVWLHYFNIKTLFLLICKLLLAMHCGSIKWWWWWQNWPIKNTINQFLSVYFLLPPILNWPMKKELLILNWPQMQGCDLAHLPPVSLITAQMLQISPNSENELHSSWAQRLSLEGESCRLQLIVLDLDSRALSLTFFFLVLSCCNISVYRNSRSW